MSTDVIRKLDEIEAEMRRLGYWSESVGEQAAGVHSCLDTPTLASWLQQLFLPNARRAACAGTLPARSQAGEIARRHYGGDKLPPEAERLLQRVREFDELCAHAARKNASGER